MMMVDVHRNMRRALSPAEVADAREVVVTLLGQARARQRKLGKAVLRLRKGPRSFKFDEVAHPRYPKGHPKGGQFRPKYASTVTLADFRLPETLGYLERDRPVRLGVNVAEVWNLFAAKSYGSPDNVAAIAIREALQNSRDACRKAGGGTIRFGLFSDMRAAWFEDTGIGMDADTLQDKFLVLGASGKQQEAGAVGGFGVAKAVILSLSDPAQGGHWEIHTRNLALTDEEVTAEEARIRLVTERRGTRLEWFDISEDLGGRCGRPARAATCGFRSGQYPHGRGDGRPGRDAPISPLRMARRTPIAEKSFHGGETTLRVYQVDLTRENKARARRGENPIIAIDGWSNVCIRLGGIAQIFTGTRAPGFYVVDVETTARPGTDTYPFDPHRTRLKYNLGGIWLRDTLEGLVEQAKTGAEVDVAPQQSCRLRPRDLTAENAERTQRLLEGLRGERERWARYAGKFRKTGIVPPPYFTTMRLHDQAQVHEEHIPAERMQRDDLDTIARRFLGPETTRGGRPQLTAKRMAGLLIAEYYGRGGSRLRQGRCGPLPVKAIFDPKVIATSLGHKWKASG